ncbi:PP2C family protein-serine/threonine phosphatase [Terriglobus sp. YAF25]|uniref:PP2C family protein-serine/threonine phosphatase n=1 Tax=Terriglobus sp. YAF25 TaxID=3233080 RepID=UPI003F9824E8
MFQPDPQLARSEVLRIFNHAQIYLFLGAAISSVGVVSSLFALLRRRFDPLLLWFALLALLYGGRLWMKYQLIWELGLRPPVFWRIYTAVGFLVPIPAFFFFRELNLLGRAGRGLLLFIGCALYGNLGEFFGRYDDIEPFGFVVLLACLGIVAGRRALGKEQQLSVIQKELEIAQRIQLSLLPVSFPVSKRFQVAARYVPMTSVAGDFYEYVVASDDEAGLLIADVSGHGVPAALIASMVKLAITTQHENARTPAELLSGMNAVLCGNTQNQFVTAGYVYLSAAERELRYAAAAHPPMLLLRQGATIEIEENGLMLAAFNFAQYQTMSVPIQPGDRFVLYTDGILEAEDAEKIEFGKDRLCALVRDTADRTCAEAADHIIASIRRWSPNQNDDLTVLICDYVA